jgi:hypothetical protein
METIEVDLFEELAVMIRESNEVIIDPRSEKSVFEGLAKICKDYNDKNKVH